MPSSPSALAIAASNGRWWLAPHIELLERAVMQLINRETPYRKLLVEMPPRHGKSEYISRYTPAWYIGTYPHQRVILCSYEANYAQRWGRKARDVLRQHGPTLFGQSISKATAATSDWEIEGTDGGMVTAGVGGAITGRGADVLIIDDPVKNADEAASPTFQERNIDWYRSTASTRLEPGGITILVTTRWNENDLAGQLLAEEGHEWLVLKLPALAEEGDPLGRNIGDPLWPERYDEEALEDIKLGRIDPATGQRHGGIGAYFWSALYQQSPTPDEGGLFQRKWWRRYRVLPNNLARGGIFIDTATDDKSTGDYFAMATWRTSGLDFYLVRMLNAHLKFPDQVRACLDAREASKLTPEDPGLPIYIEEVAWALPLIDTLKSLVGRVIGVKPGGHSKVARAMAGTPFVEAGNCYLPETGENIGDFVEQHAAFPNGAHDDMVDTTSLMFSKLATHAVPPPRKPEGRAVQYEPKALAPGTPRSVLQQRRQEPPSNRVSPTRKGLNA